MALPGGLTFSTYLDVDDFLFSHSSNIETASLIGGKSTLASDMAIGATSATIVAPQTTPISYAFPASGQIYPLWILDGPNSEVVMASTATSPANTLTLLEPPSAAHLAGVSVSSPGFAGCLASVIISASAAVESICRQGADGSDAQDLWQLTRTDTLRGPTSRCAISPDGTLTLRCYHFPVVQSSIQSINLQIANNPPLGLSLSYVRVSNDGRIVELPGAGRAPGVTWAGSAYLGRSLPRGFDMYADITYLGGPVALPGTSVTARRNVPMPIRQAMIYLVMDLLGYRSNPTGAAEVSIGNKSISQALRGDLTGESILYKQAAKLLSPFSNR